MPGQTTLIVHVALRYTTSVGSEVTCLSTGNFCTLATRVGSLSIWISASSADLEAVVPELASAIGGTIICRSSTG